LEVETPAMSAVEFPPAPWFSVVMDVEVVPNDVNLLSWVTPRHCLHELLDVGSLAAFSNFGEDLAILGIQSGEKSSRPMSNVFVIEASGAPWRGKTEGLFSSQGLHSTLLIDAENHGIARWIQVQTTDFRHLSLEQRVGAMKPHAYAVWPNFSIIQNPQN
jgi:hypothetical protein